MGVCMCVCTWYVGVCTCVCVCTVSFRWVYLCVMVDLMPTLSLWRSELKARGKGLILMHNLSVEFMDNQCLLRDEISGCSSGMQSSRPREEEEFKLK